jgi:preprotein translocase subunit Sec63
VYLQKKPLGFERMMNKTTVFHRQLQEMNEQSKYNIAANCEIAKHALANTDRGYKDFTRADKYVVYEAMAQISKHANYRIGQLEKDLKLAKVRLSMKDGRDEFGLDPQDR